MMAESARKLIRRTVNMLSQLHLGSLNGMTGLAAKPHRHVSPLSSSRGDGDAWRQLGASWLSMGGANSSFRSDPGPWVPRVVSAPPQDEKCPHLLKVATSRILWAKSLAGGERWCRIALEQSECYHQLHCVIPTMLAAVGREVIIYALKSKYLTIGLFNVDTLFIKTPL